MQRIGTYERRAEIGHALQLVDAAVAPLEHARRAGSTRELYEGKPRQLADVLTVFYVARAYWRGKLHVKALWTRRRRSYHFTTQNSIVRFLQDVRGLGYSKTEPPVRLKPSEVEALAALLNATAVCPLAGRRRRTKAEWEEYQERGRRFVEIATSGQGVLLPESTLHEMQPPARPSGVVEAAAEAAERLGGRR